MFTLCRTSVPSPPWCRGGFLHFSVWPNVSQSLQFTHCELLPAVLCGVHVAGGEILPGDNHFDLWWTRSGRLPGRLPLPPPGAYKRGPSPSAEQSGTDRCQRDSRARPPSNVWLGRAGGDLNSKWRWQKTQETLMPCDPASSDHRPPAAGLFVTAPCGWRENQRTY